MYTRRRQVNATKDDYFPLHISAKSLGKLRMDDVSGEGPIAVMQLILVEYPWAVFEFNSVGYLPAHYVARYCNNIKSQDLLLPIWTDMVRIYPISVFEREWRRRHWN
jgi:hypothetical protein